MGKCQKVITKSSKPERIGKECGIYTSKIENGLFLCSGHFKALNTEPAQEQIQEQPPKPTPANEPIKQIEESPTLEKGYPLDKVLDHKFNKKIKNDLSTPQRTPTLRVKLLLKRLFERIDKLEKKVFGDDVPEMEIFK